MKTLTERLFVEQTDTLREVMGTIDRGAKGIALVVDRERRLLATVTDGDIRRAILSGIRLDSPVGELLAARSASSFPCPVTARIGTHEAELLRVMQEKRIHHVPLLDNDGRVADLKTLDDLKPDQALPVEAVIMAGGRGERLRPLTESLPKPMLPVGDKTLLELTIERLRQAGIRCVHVTTHYLADQIAEHLGDGESLGVSVRYVAEDRPLGTAGSLSLLEKDRDQPLLVINGDILTRIDFRAMLEFHRQHRADLTVAVRQYDVAVPYGVMECSGATVRAVREKPVLDFLVNAGIYLLDPASHRFIPSNQRFDMPDLIARLLKAGRKVVAFPIVEYWLDIGKFADYQRAQEDAESERFTP